MLNKTLKYLLWLMSSTTFLAMAMWSSFLYSGPFGIIQVSIDRESRTVNLFLLTTLQFLSSGEILPQVSL